MDRNYFLSYSHIAFLLLLSTIGKLNAGFTISTAVDKSELLHCTGVNNTDLHSHIINKISQEPITVTNILQAENCKGYHHTLRNYLHLPKDNDFISCAIKGFEIVSVWKTRIQGVEHYGSTVTVFEKIKRFYINSFKLVDGFKFIIKIPDKLTIPSLR